MKKIGISFCLLFIMGILCCCGGAKDILLQTTNYSGTCHIVFEDYTYDCNLEVGEAGNLTAVFTAPVEIEGLKFCYAGEEFTLYYKDLVWSGNADDFPTNSIVTAIRNSFIESNRSDIWPQQTSDQLYIVQGHSSSGDFKFSFNEDGTPHALTVTDLNLQAEFHVIEKSTTPIDGNES